MATARMTEQQFREFQERQLGRKVAEAKSVSPILKIEPKYKLGASRFFHIRPVPAPRQSSRDNFNPSGRVKRYRDFRDACARERIWLPLPGDLVVFCMRMPKRKEPNIVAGMPHEKIPDVDNLLKALFDACYGDDKHMWTVIPAKVWHPTGGIYIERRDPAIPLPFIPAGSVPA